MPWNGAGTFSRLYSWVTDAANGVFVRADRTDDDSNDIANGISNCIAKDGQNAPIANLPMGGYRHTGWGGATATNATITDSGTLTITATTSLNIAGSGQVLVPTATAGDNSTKAASTAFVQSTAFSAALPNQTGNSGKFVTTNGTTASWAYANISTTASTVTDNFTITGTTPTIYPCITTGIGKCLTAPDATTLTKGLMYVIDNTSGGYPVGWRDSTGALRSNCVAAGGIGQVYLEDNSTAAGIWRIVGTNLEPGLITIDNTFSSTYASTVLKPYVSLDANKSIHFAALASGFAAFAVDKTTGAVGTPVTVDATASSVPKHSFMIDSTHAIVFYGTDANTLYGVVLTLSGATTLAVGTAANSGANTHIADEDFSGAPKIAQLTSSLYVVSWATATGAGNTSVMAISVSGTTVTFGSKADIIAANNVVSCTTTYPLTTTTALVFYESGAASPYNVNAVIISVSGTTCTVGTPAAAGTTHQTAGAVASCVLSSTKALLMTDANMSNVNVYVATISGTTVTLGSVLTVEAGASALTMYTSSSATRYNPHLSPLSANTALLWYVDSSGISRAVVLTESGGTVTAGTILYRSISAAAVTAVTGGVILPQGTTEFLCIGQEGITNSWKFRATANLISGTTITANGSSWIQDAIQYDNVSKVCGARVGSNNDYVLAFDTTNGAGMAAIPVIRSNGAAINMRGAIKCTPLSGMSFPLKVNNNRLILIGNTFATGGGATVGTTTYQLRLLNVEIAA